MSVSFAHSVDAHGDWRSALESRVRGLARFLREHELLDEPAADLTEIHAMLEASFGQLNTEFGFSLMSAPAVDLSRFGHDLELIERNYVQYLGLTQALKLTQARFLDQFRRMLVSRLRVVFESASGELEVWNKTASAQVDTQLRERRRGFKRRREALERIQSAAGELETRLSELADQDLQLQLLQRRMTEMVNDARVHAHANTSLIAGSAGASEPQPEPAPDTGETVDLLLDFEAAQARA